MIPKWTQQGFYGQSLTEYGIIAALVGVATIGGLLMVKDSLLAGANNLFSSPSEQKVSLTPVLAATMPTSPTGSNAGGAGDGSGAAGQTTGANGGSGGNVGLTLSNGQSLGLGITAVDTGQMIETAGANGTTQVLAEQLEIAAHQLLQQGLISEGEASQIIALANQGYKFAQIQALMLNHINTKGGEGNYDSITFDGVTYNGLDQLADRIGYSAPNDNVGQEQVPGEELAKFQNLLKSVQNIGVMGQEPAVKTLINTLSQQIVDIADVSEQTFDSAKYPDDLSEAQTRISSGYVQTAENSGSICDVGNGEKNGLSCQ